MKKINKQDILGTIEKAREDLKELKVLVESEAPSASILAKSHLVQLALRDANKLLLQNKLLETSKGLIPSQELDDLIRRN